MSLMNEDEKPNDASGIASAKLLITFSRMRALIFREFNLPDDECLFIESIDQEESNGASWVVSIESS